MGLWQRSWAHGGDFPRACKPRPAPIAATTVPRILTQEEEKIERLIEFDRADAGGEVYSADKDGL